MATSTTRRQRVGILAICSLSMLLVGLDITIVNVALPSIGKDLGTGLEGLQWTVDAYTVVLASLLLFAGSMADRLGRKRVFVTGMVVFALASVLCSLATSIGALIAFRALQAIGGSMLNPVAMSIIVNTFTDPRERAQAVGVWGGVSGLSLALGPIVGGVVVTALDWRSIFWINVPVGIVAIALTLRFIPESKAERPRRFDPVGQLLVIALLGSLTYGIIEGEAAVLAVTAFALAGLLVYEPRRAEPLITLGLFRRPPFSAAIALLIAAFMALGGFLFLNTLYLQQQRGLGPLEAGLATAPLALMTFFFSPISGRLVGARGPRIPLLLAGVSMVAGTVLLLGTDADTPLVHLLAAYVIFGIGLGFVNAPVTNAAVSSLPRAQAGVAAAMATTSRQVGSTLGVAVAGAFHPGWWVLTACSGLVLLLVPAAS
jgi:EmrB/QacA subfamily drug resistance transporter